MTAQQLSEKTYSKAEMEAFGYMEGAIRIANDQIFTSVVRNLVSDLNEEGMFDKSDILSFLQFKLDTAFEAATNTYKVIK
jgi:hypothetical protein